VTEGGGFWADRKRRNALVSATCAVVLLAAVAALFIAFRPGANDDRRMLPPGNAYRAPARRQPRRAGHRPAGRRV
jgi:hypothetical protein